MSILTLTQKLNQDNSDVESILHELQSLKKSDIVKESQLREQIISQCVQFCSHRIEDGRHAQVVKLLNFIHVANSDDDWLPTVFDRLFPQLPYCYETILDGLEPGKSVHPSTSSLTCSRLAKCELNSVRLLSAVFDLCVDFCDVVYAGEKLSVFVKPLTTLLCIPDFHDTSMAITEHGYALNELLRSAAFALSNFVLTFPMIAARAKHISKQHLEGLFNTLSCAPELSIQRSLVMILRSLYETSHQGQINENKATSDLSSAALKEMIERMFSTSQFGSGKALAAFRELQLEDHEFLVNYENVIKLMFWRKRKALKCFSTKSCHVEMKEIPSNRKRVFDSAYVEWNMNSICVRDPGGNPIQNLPLFTISYFRWLHSGKAVATCDSFGQFAETGVVLQFKQSPKRTDRKIIEERIDHIQSRVTREIQGISRKDPIRHLAHLLPVSVSVAQDNGRASNSERLSRGSVESSESSESSTRNRIETVFSGCQEDGVFITKKTSSRAESLIEFMEDSSKCEGQLEVNPEELNNSSAESTGVQDLFGDIDQQGEKEASEKVQSPQSSSVVDLIHGKPASAPAARGKARPRLQSSPPGPRILKSKSRRLRTGEESLLHRFQSSDVQSHCSNEENSQSENNSDSTRSVSRLSGHENEGDGMQDVGKGNASLLDCSAKKNGSSEDKVLELRGKCVKMLADSEFAKAARANSNGRRHSSSTYSNNSDSFQSDDDGAEGSDGEESAAQRRRSEKEKLPQVCENSMELEMVNEEALDQNQNPSLRTSAACEQLKTISMVEEEAMDPLQISEMQKASDQISCENERMRQVLTTAVNRMLKHQVDSSQRMLMDTQREVKLLLRQKLEACQNQFKAYKSKVTKLGEEQKVRIHDYSRHQRVMISKASRRVRELKLKLGSTQKQLRVLKEKMRRMVQRSSTQLKSTHAKMDDQIAELVASVKRREERSTRSSLVQNLMSMLGNR